MRGPCTRGVGSRGSICTLRGSAGKGMDGMISAFEA